MSNEDESSTKLDVIHNPSTTPWFIAWCVCVTKPSMLILEQVWTYQPITITVKHSFLKSTIKRSKIRWKNIYFFKIITQVDLTWKLTFHHCIMLGNWSRFDNYSKNIYNQILLITQFLQMGMKKSLVFQQNVGNTAQLMAKLPACQKEAKLLFFFLPWTNKVFQLDEDRFHPESNKAVISISEIPLAWDMRGKGHYKSFHENDTTHHRHSETLTHLAPKPAYQLIYMS